MVDLSVVVMAHRKREEYVTDLVAKMGIDDEQVVWDRRDDRWDTGRRAMQAGLEAGSEWHAVVQDDVLVCKDFVAGLTKALEHVPEHSIVQPYVGTRRPLQGYVLEAIHAADAANVSWIEMKALLWGIVIVVPTWTIEKMLPWCDRRPYPNYDKRVGQYYLAKLYYPTWYTWPSLVDHRDNIPSLVGHGAGRIAHRFIGEDVSALDIDWSTGVSSQRGVAGLKHRQRALQTDPRYARRVGKV
jgi:hypothetical protein